MPFADETSGRQFVCKLNIVKKLKACRENGSKRLIMCEKVTILRAKDSCLFSGDI